MALLHLLPIVGDIQYNQDLIERAVKQAANQKVDWVLTPELAVSGLQFSRKIGTDWIKKQPDEWMSHFCAFVKRSIRMCFLAVLKGMMMESFIIQYLSLIETEI